MPYTKRPRPLEGKRREEIHIEHIAPLQARATPRKEVSSEPPVPPKGKRSPQGIPEPTCSAGVTL